MIKEGSVVKIHYDLKLLDGKLIDSSFGKEALEFTIGKNQVIPGFESAIMGMSTGEKTTISVPVETAYGPYRPELVMKIEKNLVPQEVEIGEQLQSVSPDGQTFLVKVVGKDDTTYVLDANHPLAGESLIFDVEVIEII